MTASDERKTVPVDGDSGVTYTQGQLIAALIFSVSAALAVFAYLGQQFDLVRTQFSAELAEVRAGVAQELTESDTRLDLQIQELGAQINFLRLQMAERYVTQETLDRVREDIINEMEQRCE